MPPRGIAIKVGPLLSPFLNREALSVPSRTGSSSTSMSAPQAANTDDDLSYKTSVPFQTPRLSFDVSLPVTHSYNGKVANGALEGSILNRDFKYFVSLDNPKLQVFL